MEFTHRGVVEGFYGPAWSQIDRLWMLERLGDWGMNRYLYAPKDDPLHRAQWRDPYPDGAMRDFSALIECGAQRGVDVGFALSPGLSIHYSSAQDVAALAAKFKAFALRGARFFGLALDDIPSDLSNAEDRRAFSSLADAHVRFAHALREALGPDCLLWLVPTDYMGAAGSAYLDEMGERLDPSIEVGWTGASVLPARIRASEAATRAAALHRRLLVWDNTPVSDGPMRNTLHLGPYSGRDPGILQHCSGVLLNPMQHARASAVSLRTAADFLADPDHYDAERSWRTAVSELGTGAPEAFASFATAHRFSVLTPDDRDRELETAVEALRSALAVGDEPTELHSAIAALDRLLAERESAAPRIRADLEDAALVSELKPWLASHERECQRMRAAVNCLEILVGAESPNAKGLAFTGMEARLTRLPVPAVASFGPRRAFYPVFESLDADTTRFASAPGLFVDHCLADEVIRLAEDRATKQLGLVRG